MGVIDSYVTDLARVLHGPRRAKADMVREARDSLHDAAQAYEARGSGAAEAELRAVGEFGSIDEIAPGYQAELSLAQTRRTAMLMFTVLVAQTVAWGPARTSVVGHPESHTGLAQTLDQVMAVAGTSMMLAAVAVLLGLRFAPTRPALARVAGAVGVAMSVSMAGLGVAISAFDGQHAHMPTWSGLPWTVGFGVLPLLWTAMSARALIRTGR